VPCLVRVTDRFRHVPLYLIEPERAEDRWITRRLYEAGTDPRLAQEILLGIGGLRALNWLGIPISTYHFNEGHAVFAGVEMIAERMEGGLSFPEAWADTRKRIVFTTHTPVREGNEEHAIKELRRMGACLELSGAEMRALGGDPFNLTVAGLRLSRRANAVSQLHAETSRAMWAHVTDAGPIIGITNGVHAPTWQSERVRGAAGDPEALWQAHTQHKAELLAEIQARNGTRFDPDALLIGFARRAAGYKRPDLILHDPAWLDRAFAEHNVQLVFAGKAHPDDHSGKAVVARLVSAQRQHPGRVVFLENYEMRLGRLLTRGCDVWLNNPVRPLEASGTSGMKAALNGVLNLSVLDGWWPEGCEHGVNGWAIGDSNSGDDAKDLAALHEVLVRQVLPAWGDRRHWVAMMQASIGTAEAQFTSERMVREYDQKLYAATEPARVS
jgi:starch phosphorylase